MRLLIIGGVAAGYPLSAISWKPQMVNCLLIVAIFGIGGVGSFVLEGLVRAGVENFIFGG